MKKLIYPILGLAFILSMQSCLDEYKAKYLEEKTLADDVGVSFVKNGLEGGMTEIKASSLAATNSQNTEVKDLAQKMIADHSAADSTLLWIENDKLITEKDTISGEHQEMIDSLAKKTGADFDKAYIAMMIKDHEDAVELFTEASDDKNQTIRDFAGKTLPTIKMHLEDAEKIQTSLK